ncbi:hypothetical protein CL657_01240 [bacterium]|nr:hypothetical protein [bacterium]
MATAIYGTRPFVSFSVDSRLATKPYNTKSVADATLFFYDATNMAYWYSIKQLSYFNRKAGFYTRAFLTGLIINNSFFQVFSLPYKEFGHGSRGRAFGIAPQYKLDNQDKIFDSYYSLFGDILFNVKEKTISETVKPNVSDIDVHSSVNTSDFDLIWYAGGANNLMYLSQRIDDRFYERNVTSVYDFLGFLSSKMAISHMDISYLNNIKQVYNQQGIDMSISDFKRYNGYAVLSSFTFWSFVDGWSRYLVSGIDYIQYNEFKQLRMPDVSMYLTSHGPSYRVQSGYKWSTKMQVPVAIEYVFKGETQFEYTVGLSKTWSALPLQTYSEIRLGEGFGLSQLVSINLPYFSKLGFGLDYYDFNNLFGERQIPSLKNGNNDLSLWVAYSFRQ